MNRDTQTGFGFEAGPGFDFGGQGGFAFDPEPSEFERQQRDRQRRHAEEARRERERARAEQEAREKYHQRASHTHTFQDPYEVLGLRHGAGKVEIRKAWAAKMKACHPDLGGSLADAQRYNAAYESLKGGRR